MSFNSKKKTRAASPLVGFIPLAIIVVIVGAYMAYILSNNNQGTTSTTTTTTGVMQGVVVGYVTVGPSQPVCNTNQSCNVDVSGYKIIFVPQQCVSNCASYNATLGPNGHYSILLPAGTYSVTGLYPNCTWMGCSSAFPKTVVVQGGMQINQDFNIDTGIR